MLRIISYVIQIDNVMRKKQKVFFFPTSHSEAGGVFSMEPKHLIETEC